MLKHSLTPSYIALGVPFILHTRDRKHGTARATRDTLKTPHRESEEMGVDHITLSFSIERLQLPGTPNLKLPAPISLVYPWIPNGNLSDYLRDHPDVDKPNPVSGHHRQGCQPSGGLGAGPVNQRQNGSFEREPPAAGLHHRPSTRRRRCS